MKRLKSIFLAAFAVVIAASSVLLIPVGEQVSAQSSAALSIVPRKNYTVEPGKSVKDTLIIRNIDSERPLALSLRIVDFTFTDEGGTPKLFLDEDAPQTTWSMKPFLTVPEYVEIEPGGTKSVDLNVAIPANQGAGSYYSAIVYSSGASEGGNVGLSASGVTLVFTQIPGDVNEDLQLERLGAYKFAEEGKPDRFVSFTTAEPEAIAFTLKNNGNVAEAPVGSIVLRDLFGNERRIDNINPNGSLALIGQTRTFTTCIKLKAEEVEFNGGSARSTACAESAGLWPGFYSINLEMYYGQNGNPTKDISDTAWFIYAPWWFIIALIVVIALAVYFIRKAVLAVRRRFYGAKKPRRR